VPDTHAHPPPSVRAELPPPTKAGPVADFSKACTDLAFGIMEATIAQAQLATTVYTDTHMWSSIAESEPKDAPIKALAAAREQAETSRQRLRQINDDLSAKLFTATETMMKAWQEEGANLMRFAALGQTTAAA